MEMPRGSHLVHHKEYKIDPSFERPVGAPYGQPPCECRDCAASFFTQEQQNIERFCYLRELSEEEAKRVIYDYISQINSDRTALLQQCHFHGSGMIARWRKLTRTKRSEMLYACLPEIFLMEPHVMIRHSQCDFSDQYWREIRELSRNYYLLPFLSLELLLKNPLILFSLIQNRIEFTIEDWIPFDFDETTFGWAHGFLATEFNPSCIVMCGRHFGKFTPWVQEEIKRGYTIGFPRAKLVLEAQAVLLKFLRQMAESIIGDNPLDRQAAFTRWTTAIDRGLTQNSGSNWSHYALRPFSAPPVLSLNKLLSDVKARVEATGDHLWLLQTEPSYLKHHIRSVRQNEVFQICLKSESVKLLIGEITLDIFIHWSWQWILDELIHAQSLYYQHQDSIGPETPLPSDYDLSLAAIESILLNMLYRRIGQLQALIPQRPAFRHLHDFRYENGNPESIGIRTKEEINTCCRNTFQSEPLYYCLTQMLGDPSSRTRVPIEKMFSFLDEHLATSTAAERSKLDPILYAKLSDYAAIYDIFTSLRFNPPRATWICVCEPRKFNSKGILRYFASQTKDIDLDPAITRLLKDFIQTPLPSGGKNRNWLDGFSDVHSKLQKFWKGIHDRFEVSLMKSELSAEDRHSDLEALQHWRNPDYHKRFQAKYDGILADIESRKKANNTVINNDYFLPILYLDDKLETFRPSECTVKAKTRGKGSGRPDQVLHHRELGEKTMPQPQPSIRVNKKTLSTFRTMFPSTPEERQKTLDWDTFVRSMQHVGFSASNGGGSVVIFQKTDEKMKSSGRILFHKPHPVPKIDSVMFQGMGRRMNKWFGWHRDLFILQEKST